MKEPKVIEIFADNGEHSHWQLIDENGEILWSEEPNEVKNNAVLPLVSSNNLIIKCLPFGVKELESEYYLEQYNINKDTIISINSLHDNDENVLVYYWG